MYVKARKVDAYAGNPQKWVVERIENTEPTNVTDGVEVTNLPELFWIPNRCLAKCNNDVLTERVELGSLGYPRATYTFDREEIEQYVGKEITTDEFRNKYVANGNEYWTKDSPLGLWQQAGGEIEVIWKNGNLHSISLPYVNNGFVVFPRIWVHPDYRDVSDLYDHPAYTIAEHLLQRSDVQVSVAPVPEDIMSDWKGYFDEYLESDNTIDYSEDLNALWVGGSADVMPAHSEVPTDWRDLVNSDDL